MVQFDNQRREAKLKVVYYGPGLGGKTTCLEYLHRVTDPQRRTKLYTLNTAADRTLFFDLLGLDLGRVRGYRLTLQLYTVPGQVQYNTTRRAVLGGCDGVMFVADSRRGLAKANEESLANLIENLRANGVDPDAVPIVLSYNKRDLPDAMPREELDRSLNARGLPAFETVATTGEGVAEAFAAIAQAAVLSLADRAGLSGQPDERKRTEDALAAALQPLLRGATAAGEEAIVVQTTVSGESVSDDELLAEAVRANLALTDLNARFDRLTTALERRMADLRSINDFGRAMSAAREPEEVTAAFLDRLLSELKVGCGSLLLLDHNGELVEVLRRGFAADPLARRSPNGPSPAEAVLGVRRPLVVRTDEPEGEPAAGSPWLEELRSLGLVGALAVPLVAQDRALGTVTAFADAAHGPFEEEAAELASAMAANAATALANARAWRSLEQLNRSLEETVAERTAKLQEALDNARALADQLEERTGALEAANRRLRDLERLKGDLLQRVAHELNTPVTAIQTAGRILSRYDEMPPDKAAKFVDIITGEATRLAELVSSSLQALVLGVPEGRPAPTAVEVPGLLRRVVAPLKGDIAAKHLAVQVQVAAGLDELVGDGDQLETALRAAVRNAIDFNRDGGRLAISVRPLRRGASSLVELRVEDTGVGIPAQDLAHVTDVFWQGGNPLTAKPRGLGLGLAVARRVAENHGGTLEVASEEGVGTVVSLLLPAAEPGAPGPEPSDG